jgi:predicted lactoylglutathione lyase
VYLLWLWFEEIKMDVQRVTMVTLAVADLAVSRGFYERLGWVEAEGGNDNIAFFKLRGLFMGLYSRDKLTDDIGLPIQKRATGSITLATNYGSQAEVDVAYKSALDAGAVAITKPEEVFWGGHSGYYADPDGHLWEMAHNPFWSFDEDGYLVGNA